MMLSEYITKQLEKARYRLLRDGTYFGEIPGAKGVWANAKSLESCRRELREVLEDWLFLKVRAGDKITGFEIKVDRRELVRSAR